MSDSARKRSRRVTLPFRFHAADANDCCLFISPPPQSFSTKLGGFCRDSLVAIHEGPDPLGQSRRTGVHIRKESVGDGNYEQSEEG